MGLPMTCRVLRMGTVSSDPQSIEGSRASSRRMDPDPPDLPTELLPTILLA